jgi:hypothetical protein
VPAGAELGAGGGELRGRRQPPGLRKKSCRLGNGANSNLVMALQGKGPLFGNAGAFPQTPANADPPGKPYFTAAQVEPIIDWINRGCPNPGGT